MCGIAGLYNYRDLEYPADANTVAHMCRVLRHRGPDDEGVYTDGPAGLGSRRLSIIDLERGHMPLCNEDASIWITYNGETYNAPELRRELQRRGHTFRTHSDTETIVHLYEEEGLEFAKRLNGMFAFAIWDSRLKRLVLVRDQLGIKPLVYTAQGDTLYFASEIRALLAAGVPRAVDPIALHDYLSLNYVPGPRTIFEGVSRLQPGHMLVAENGAVTISRYWDLAAEVVETGGFREAELEEHLLSLLRSAVRDSMVSDVPVGAFLSGGLDSSVVATLMTDVSEQPVKTFSIGFSDPSYSELPYARIVANSIGSEHHELCVNPSADDIVEVARSFDEPFADNSAIATYAVSRLAAKHVKVVLSGDGGDEVFGGYSTYQADRLLTLLRRLRTSSISSAIRAAAALTPTTFKKASLDFKLKRFAEGAHLDALPAHYSWKAYMSEEQKAALRNGNAHVPVRPTVQLFEEAFASCPSADVLNRLIHVDSCVQLPDDMLSKVDRTSMAHSLEVRVPLLDRRLVSFMASLPSRYKVSGFRLKHLFKNVARHIVPKEIINRRKAGFTVPIAQWIAKDLNGLVREQLSTSKLREQGFFDPAVVNTMLTEHESQKRDYGRTLWALLVFGLWYEGYCGTQSERRLTRAA